MGPSKDRPRRGTWTDKAPFEQLGSIAEDVIAHGGLSFIDMPDDRRRYPRDS
jgi:hypothetical protein